MFTFKIIKIALQETQKRPINFLRQEDYIKSEHEWAVLIISPSSSLSSVSCPGPDSSRYVIHHRPYHFDILIPEYSSMASTPELSKRRTRGLPRRDYNALHNGLLSSPSQQSEESTCEAGRRYSPEPSPSRDLENIPQSKRSYSLLSSSPSPLDPAFSESMSDTSSPHPQKRRKPKSYSSWTIEHF